jgi:hypothetical protein
VFVFYIKKVSELLRGIDEETPLRIRIEVLNQQKKIEWPFDILEEWLTNLCPDRMYHNDLVDLTQRIKKFSYPSKNKTDILLPLCNPLW